MSKMKLLFILLICASLALALPLGQVPTMDGVPAFACLGIACDENEEGPVCAIDASGQARTFESMCHLELASCRESIIYAIVGRGEC